LYRLTLGNWIYKLIQCIIKDFKKNLISPFQMSVGSIIILPRKKKRTDYYEKLNWQLLPFFKRGLLFQFLLAIFESEYNYINSPDEDCFRNTIIRIFLIFLSLSYFFVFRSLGALSNPKLQFLNLGVITIKSHQIFIFQFLDIKMCSI
jgi:hypothetical protein